MKMVQQKTKDHHTAKASVVLGNFLAVTCTHTHRVKTSKVLRSVNCAREHWEATIAMEKVLPFNCKFLISVSVLQRVTCEILAKVVTLVLLLPSPPHGIAFLYL